MNKAKCYLFILSFVALTISGIAQNIGINTTGATPDASAMLDIVATDAGMLVPRMTTAQRDAITSPADALLVYCTDSSPEGFYFYDGTNWVALVSTITNNSSSPTSLTFGGNTIMALESDYNSGGNIVWEPSATGSIAGATSNTDGAANTAAIVAAIGAGNYAAYYCDTLTAHGYSDWYLPARDELSLLSQHQLQLPSFPASAVTGYWSSTQVNATQAYWIIAKKTAYIGTYFFGFTESSFTKTAAGKCRCIRKP